MSVTPFPAPGARGVNWAPQLTEAIETRDEIIRQLAEERVELTISPTPPGDGFWVDPTEEI